MPTRLPANVKCHDLSSPEVIQNCSYHHLASPQLTWWIMLQLCLELLLTTALRNRDRIQILWPLLHDVLALILGPNATRTSTEVPPLVRSLVHHPDGTR